jgi:hypothetical protein
MGAYTNADAKKDSAAEVSQEDASSQTTNSES